ncbi:MAG TPA: 23S rRNA (adenine(2503)-C(2))-methyltransferase RlmN [Pseudomonadales bacterium]|jgi:23S rRNA (adenine2503-C2)-methyltransferase|nr:23S rRNA (adenine(2503)-C(2))-methyltransferase RlmN [Pseudomonadales bacterium]HMW15097.1 23S rRNA (adenine(2503)-C(2))-methyltransferase RlmN [Pseudomonadales bacterium]HMW82201.1 23S rRNA (adenine(2503)-C(2))-methyltransferase RlmN [Pseudomonadales bacterium]HMY96084.1 23S rRNA (adenine(2503)-C(2))-methyltransferase RlmN [Pseudomonadales bacterium]HMZ69885.1 23S rRNA (adenine(2503)-C(2))-methyltransferase RlmN [Pseudomonadales bacterium]
MGETTRINLLGLSRPKLEQFFAELGEKRFRVDQTLKWLHHRRADSFDQMSDLSKGLRTRLGEVAEIRPPEVVHRQRSLDGTRKWLIRVESGSCVEMVFIPQNGRGTLCVSSQVGCALDCSFCSTGKQGFNSNLTAAEIIGQVRIAVDELAGLYPERDRAVTNVVLMGMGEPLLNFDNVVDAVQLMMDDFGYGISKRRVTLSTAGLAPMIERLGEVTDVSLAISLHATTNALRDQLVPVNRKYPIEVLFAACQRYFARLGEHRSLTIEYTLLDGINDQPEQARELAVLSRILPSKINLIPFNPFPNSGYRCSSPAAIDAFLQILQREGCRATIRATRGDDIDAACGQLVGQVSDRTRRQQRHAQRHAAELLAQPLTLR